MCALLLRRSSQAKWDKIKVFNSSTKLSFIFTMEGSLLDKTDFYLSGTCCHKTGTRTPSCQTPRQTTINANYKDHFGQGYTMLHIKIHYLIAIYLTLCAQRVVNYYVKVGKHCYGFKRKPPITQSSIFSKFKTKFKCSFN